MASYTTAYITKHDIDEAVARRDLGFLTDQILNLDMEPEVREYLRSIVHGLLSGKRSFPNRRPRVPNRQTVKIVRRVWDLQFDGCAKVTAAVNQVAAEFRCSERKVY